MRLNAGGDQGEAGGKVEAGRQHRAAHSQPEIVVLLDDAAARRKRRSLPDQSLYQVCHLNGRTSAMILGYECGLGTSTHVSALEYQSVKSMKVLAVVVVFLRQMRQIFATSPFSSPSFRNNKEVGPSQVRPAVLEVSLQARVVPRALRVSA